MPLIATPGASNANSYATPDDLDAYNEIRYPQFTFLSDDQKEALLIQATRVLDLSLSGVRKLVYDGSNQPSYYRIGPRWSGAPSTETQALAWPRTGMLNRNGFAISSSTIPEELKNAVCELAGQMTLKNRLTDNAVMLAGLKSFSAGPVSFSFKDAIDIIKLLPDYVLTMLVPSWILDETTIGTTTPMFEVL